MLSRTLSDNAADLSSPAGQSLKDISKAPDARILTRLISSHPFVGHMWVKEPLHVAVAVPDSFRRSEEAQTAVPSPSRCTRNRRYPIAAVTPTLRATCREAARATAPGGWFVIVSHIHPSTAEGAALMSEAFVPGLHDSTAAREGRGSDSSGARAKEKEEEAFFWSVDVHCGGGGDEDGKDEEGEGDRDMSDGSGGPSVYMARKVWCGEPRADRACVLTITERGKSGCMHWWGSPQARRDSCTCLLVWRDGSSSASCFG